MINQVIFSALLHDIGKLFFKSEKSHKNHLEAGLFAANELWNQEIPQLIKEGIKYHHFKNLKAKEKEVLPETWLIYEADNISAGLDRREEQEIIELQTENKQKFDSKMALVSTFELLNSAEENLNSLEEIKNKAAYKLQMLGEEDKNNQEPEIIYPEPNLQNTTDEYKKLANRWNTQVSKHKDILIQNPNAMLSLMESVLSYAPSDTCTERIPDISLYEHLRITAGIASCMYLYGAENKINYQDLGHWDKTKEHRQQPQFLLVGGSVSGIQKFIYNITSKGALKGLRARSFYLEVLIEHIIDEILELCGGLSRANIIYSGGGNFYLLLPNTEACKSVLENIEKKLNEWLWENFRGSLSFAIDYIECSSAELMDKKNEATKKRQGLMASKWKELSSKLSSKKAKKFAVLNNEKFNSILEPQENVFSSEECAISRVDHDLIDYDFGNEKKKCNFMAASLQKLGQKLPKANFIRIEKNKSKTTKNNLQENCVFLPDLINENKECWLSLIEASGENQTNISRNLEEQILNNIKNNRLYSINRWVLSKAIHAVLMIGNYYPTLINDDMPDFEDLAKKSIGNKKIGVLRADIDDLGTLFTSKLQSQINTFSRSAMLAKHLSMFFKLYINQICRAKLGENLESCKLTEYTNQEKSRNVVIVYSGGDDLFIVGAWNEVIELSVDIQKCFEKYTCGKLTLSAGVQVFAPKTPIIEMAKKTEIAEKKAKNNKYKNTEKNSICIFPNPRELEYYNSTQKREIKHTHKDTYNWEEFQRLLQNIENFKSFAKDNPSFTYKLYSTVEDLFSKSEQGLINLPRLAYMLTKLEDRIKDQKEIIQEFNKAIDNYLLDCESKNADQDIGLRLKDIKTLTTIVNYLQRKE